MYTVLKLDGYKTIAEFAKEYVTPKGKHGVTRAYLMRLMDKEKKKQGSTGLDIVEVMGTCYVRYERK